MNNDIYEESSMFHPNPSTFNIHRRQYFSLPFGIISYITQNPNSTEGYSKLQKTCKYFFAKNNIIILNGDTCIEYYNIDFTSLILDAPSIYKEYKIYFKKGFKYWINKFFNIQYFDSLEFLQNIYRCSLNNLDLNDLTLTMDEFDFLIYDGKVTLIWLSHVKIYDKKNVLVSIDKILKKLPNIKDFHYNCENEIFTTKIFEEMDSLSFSSKFNNLHLSVYNLAPNTDVTLLCDFGKKNCGFNKHFAICFLFDGAEIYQAILQAAITKMLQTWDSEEKPPNVFVYIPHT